MELDEHRCEECGGSLFMDLTRAEPYCLDCGLVSRNFVYLLSRP